ncbi:hypothetical protein Sta7437_3314 [Stanieria cyanosphaera PCC 7437]|uniref:Uncharacterized protein n=1 Tax=Stanieria cyanosphaera (strain ATCC 29371 / PCC 7437) TaxID=111780 RepID=K9XXJ3_STAC7|nr:hypothetical protein Sta7437_3314 [Stanieria cyanosphaera PCC 7437]
MSIFPLPHELTYLYVKIAVLLIAIALWFAVTAAPVK